jgi:hypothetical protein
VKSLYRSRHSLPYLVAKHAVHMLHERFLKLPGKKKVIFLDKFHSVTDGLRFFFF